MTDKEILKSINDNNKNGWKNFMLSCLARVEIGYPERYKINVDKYIETINYLGIEINQELYNKCSRGF